MTSPWLAKLSVDSLSSITSYREVVSLSWLNKGPSSTLLTDASLLGELLSNIKMDTEETELKRAGELSLAKINSC
jgi:hypothetical protein